jgi:hypothetical protein
MRKCELYFINPTFWPDCEEWGWGETLIISGHYEDFKSKGLEVVKHPKRISNEFGLPFLEDGSIISSRNIDNHILNDTALRLGIS